MNSFFVLLFCTINFRPIYAQYISNEDTKQYLTKVMNVLFENLLEYGLSNLPIEDVTTLTYNSSDLANYYGYNLNGDLILEDGFALSVQSIKGFDRDASTIISKDGARIKNSMFMTDVEVLRDFHFSAQNLSVIPDRTRGVIIIKPKKFAYGYEIRKSFITGEVIANITNVEHQIGKDRLEFIPETGLTIRLRKLWNYGWDSDVLSDMNTKWMPIFEKLLLDAVKTIEFPAIDFPVSRFVNHFFHCFNVPSFVINNAASLPLIPEVPSLIFMDEGVPSET